MAPFVTGVDKLDEEIAAVRNDWEVDDLIDDEQRKTAEEPEFLAQSSFVFCLGKGPDDIGEARPIARSPAATSFVRTLQSGSVSSSKSRHFI